jgi:hypothetical protein
MSNEPQFELQYIKYIEDILYIKNNVKQPLKSRLRDIYLKLSNYIDATEVIFETFNKEVYGDEEEESEKEEDDESEKEEDDESEKEDEDESEKEDEDESENEDEEDE